MSETVDAMMRGRFAIVQDRDGHRAGLDAMLLAATIPPDARGRLIDLGAGCGTAAFAALTRAPHLTATLVERDPDECDRASRALALDGNAHLAGRVETTCGAVEHVSMELADFVIANPPYNGRHAQPSPSQRRSAAHMGDTALVGGWMAAAARAAKRGAMAAFILRAESWIGGGDALSANGFGDVRLLPIQPRADRPANRIVLIGRRNRLTPASILPPLIVHRPDGAFTPRVAAILDGAAGLFDEVPHTTA